METNKRPLLNEESSKMFKVLIRARLLKLSTMNFLSIAPTYRLINLKVVAYFRSLSPWKSVKRLQTKLIVRFFDFAGRHQLKSFKMCNPTTEVRHLLKTFISHRCRRLIGNKLP